MQRFGRETAPAQTDDGRHAWIVPAIDDAFFDQFAQLAFAGDDVGQVQAGEFILARQWFFKVTAFGQTFQYPVIERTVILKFERANRVRDVFQRIRDRMREVVHRINAPGVAGAVVVGMADTVQRRIAQIHVGGGHVDTGTQDVQAIGKLTGFHAPEQVQ